MAFNFLQSSDAGAPTFTGAAGSVISLLDACLVNGYGSKTPLGWTKAFSGTNTAAYRQSGTTNNVYLRISDTNATLGWARCRMYGAMTDVDTGTDPAPTEAQIAGGMYLIKSGSGDTTTPRPWVVLGNEKSFYMWIGHNNTLTQGIYYQSAYNTCPPAYFFGDFKSYLPGDQWNKVIFANYNTSWAGTSIAYNTGISTVHGCTYVMRPYLQVGSAINGGLVLDMAWAGGDPSASLAGTPFPDPISGGMRLGTVKISEPSYSSVRGEYPGRYVIYNYQPPITSGDEFDGSGQFLGKRLKFMKAGTMGTSSWAGWMSHPWIINDAWGSY